MRTAHPRNTAPGLLSGEGSFEKNPQPGFSLPPPSHPGMTLLTATHVLSTANKIIIINPALLSRQQAPSPLIQCALLLAEVDPS